MAAAHVKDRYDRLWATEQASSRDPGWHRTGDVGHLDADGRLWVEGRLVHVITTADGPRDPGRRRAADRGARRRRPAPPWSGSARPGTQQVVAVVVPSDAPPSDWLARPGAGRRGPSGGRRSPWRPC